MAALDPKNKTLPRVELSHENGTPVLSFFGELDLPHAAQVQAALDAAVPPATERVVFEMSGLEFMDSSGIALLVHAAQRAREVEVRNPSVIVRRLIELTGLTQTLRIAP
jgi:anti-anti-sigma factor